MQYKLVGNEDGSSTIAVFVDGEMYPAHSDHVNFDKIVAAAVAGDEGIVDLFDASIAVATKFSPVSERVSVANGRVYFDGVEMTGPFVDQILRFMDEGEEDYMPLVNFFEKVQQNPQEYSREQLQGWLATKPFTITPSGDIVGYKGVRTTDEGMTSISTGTAIVNDEVKKGNIPYAVGDVVTMPRDQVQFDPSEGCSTGLHVGTYNYANGFAQGALLEVHVNPRDVVSVPDDSQQAKMRVSRFTVVDIIDAPYTAPVLSYEEDFDDFDEEHYCLDCGDVLDDGLYNLCDYCG